jgi:hypothetical protein
MNPSFFVTLGFFGCVGWLVGGVRGAVIAVTIVLGTAWVVDLIDHLNNRLK